MTYRMYVWININRMAIMIPTTVATIMMELHLIMKLVKGTHKNAKNKKSTHPKTSQVDCDMLQLTNAQCDMVLIYIYNDKANPELYNWNNLERTCFNNLKKPWKIDYSPTHLSLAIFVLCIQNIEVCAKYIYIYIYNLFLVRFYVDNYKYKYI